MSDNMWDYGESSGGLIGADLVGYKVEASDGSIGTVDKHSDEVDSSYIVVDTGPWIFGKEVLLPAGTIERIDVENEKVHVSRTKEQIKSAPEFDKDLHLADESYHQQLGTHYGPGEIRGDHRS